MSLYFLIYSSQERAKFSPRQLDSLMVLAREKNTSLSITGLLLYRSGTFIQYLEGPRTMVAKLLEDILNDSRHSNIKVLERGPIQERKFNSWSMLLKNLDYEDIRSFEQYKKDILFSPSRHSTQALAEIAKEAITRIAQVN